MDEWGDGGLVSVLYNLRDKTQIQELKNLIPSDGINLLDDLSNITDEQIEQYFIHAGIAQLYIGMKLEHIQFTT